MRKLLTRWMALCLCVVLCIALAACGGKTAKEEDPVGQDATTPSATPKTDEENSAKDGDSETLESFISKHQSEFDEMIESELAPLAEEGMSIEVIAKGNTMIYNFTYDDGVEEFSGADLETVKVYLNTALNSAESYFNDILEYMQEEVPSTESIVVNYLDKDGSLIATREYDGSVSEGSGNALEDFVAQNQELLNQTMSGLADEDISISITAEGNTLVYNFIFETGVEEYLDTDLETAKLFLEEEVSAELEPTFNDILDIMQAAVPGTEAIRIDFLDQNGDLIYAKEFN